MSAASCGGKLPFVQHEGAQVFALDELHSHELHSLGIAQVINTDDVLVGHLRRQKQFLLEAVNDGLAAGQVRTNHFQCHQTIQFEVASLVNRTHAALTEDLQNFVTLAQKLTRLQLGRITLASGQWGQRW